MLAAMVAYARGAVALAKASARRARQPARGAADLARTRAPYEVARTRALVAQACSALGDKEAATLELEAARDIFRRLGAAPDLARLEPGREHAPNGLSRARARGAAARRVREEQPRDRRGARHQRAHGRTAPAEHLREARRLLTRGGDRLRVRARSRLSGGAWSEMTTSRGRKLVNRRDAVGPHRPTVLVSTNRKGGRTMEQLEHTRQW